MVDRYALKPTGNPQPYRGIRGEWHCKTKGTFFVNVVFWGSFRAVGTFKFRVNRQLGISVSPYTEIILKNVLGGSKNLPDNSKLRYRL